jgi:hypothetical protein
MEVVVTFVQGDVDRPLVIGTVYNAAAPFPFPLPGSATQSGWRTRSTPGGNGSNELQFEDAAGKEKVFLHAQRDMEEVVGHDHYSDVTRHRTLQVGGDRYLAVKGNSIEVIDKSQSVTIKEDMILHIVGRHFIQVDGATSGEGDEDDEAESEAPASHGDTQAQGARSAPRDDGTASTELTRARLLWAAERAPDEEYEAARAQVDVVDAFAEQLSSLCAKALEGSNLADADSRSAVGEALGAFGTRLAGAIVEAMSKRTAVTGAAVDALRSLHTDSVRARAALAAGPEGEAEIRGVIRGGGGGGGSDGCPDIPEPQKPKPKPKDSGTIKIKGGYTIASPPASPALTDDLRKRFAATADLDVHAVVSRLLPFEPGKGAPLVSEGAPPASASPPAEGIPGPASTPKPFSGTAMLDTQRLASKVLAFDPDSATEPAERRDHDAVTARPALAQTAELDIHHLVSKIMPFGASQAAPTGPHELTLEQFASLTAEIATSPERAAETRAKYGLPTEQAHRALSALWQQRFAENGALQERYLRLVSEYRAWLQQRR